jgi:DNA-binding response OmpR family regulator
LTQTIRSANRDRTVPIIALSASASQYTRQEALDAGCNVFLSKPVKFAALIEAVGNLLHLQWQHRETAARIAEDDATSERFDSYLDPSLADELYHLALEGDVKALLERASATMNEQLPMYSEIRLLAEQYDMGALRRILSQHRGES